MICPSCQAENENSSRSCFACGARLEPALADLRPGALFAGRYEIAGSLGRGGMGMVYRAFDREIGEEVAIKVLRPDIARQSSRVEKRFRAEIRLARRVRHRNVCSVYGDGIARGLLYICMELVLGENLVGLTRANGGLPPAEAWDALRQVADGLRAIHQAGIVHRDLKTGNLMRDREGVVRVMDFGIAKHYEAGDTVTATGTLMGTPEYMSPEQLRGEAVGYRSDIYSLGVVVYELFTGTVPFRGETPVVTILRQLEQEPELEKARLPTPLRPVLHRALAKDPEARFASAAEMRQALHTARVAAEIEGGDDRVFWVSPGHDAVGETRPVGTAVGARERAPVARIVIGVLGVTALATHLMSASMPRAAAAPMVPAAPTRSAPAPRATPAVVAAATPVPREAPSPLPRLAPAPEPPPPAVASVPEPVVVVPGELAALVPTIDTSRVYERKDVDVEPRRISGQNAGYPRGLPTLSRGERVSITASFVVTERGDVTDIRVEGGDQDLRSVLVEISRWKYEPGLKGGIPVKVRMLSRHTFVGG